MFIGREHPVLVHIEDAESWLARAKTNYRTANEIRGELDLSLAQAELRYAWELSRKRSKKGFTALNPNRRPSVIRRLLPLVAAVIFVFGLLLVVRPWERLPHRETPLARATPSGPSEETAVDTGAEPPASTSAVSAPALTPVEEQTARRMVTRVKTPPDSSPMVNPQPATTSSDKPVESYSPVEKGRETEGASSDDSPSAPSPSEPLPAPAREEPLPPAADLKPAAQLGFELGELERVAKETLIFDGGSIYRDH